MKKYIGFLIVLSILTFGATKVQATVSVDNNIGCLPSYRYNPMTGQPCSSILPIPVTPPIVINSILDTTPRIMYWYGKVNQHVDANGNWQTDPDGISGADLDKLNYCKKWFPRTIRVEDYRLETINSWRNRGNIDGPFTSTKMSTKCIQSEVNVLPIIVDNPVISGISGPQFLDINSVGTWKVEAYNPTGGNLSYKVDWGDIYESCPIGGPCTRALSLVEAPFGQSATFTHSFSRAGIYNPTFTVRNDKGGTATTSLSVKVGKTESNASITIISPNGGEVYKAGQEIKVKWSSIGIPKNDYIQINLLNEIDNKEYQVGIIRTLNDGEEVFKLPKIDWDGTSIGGGQKYKIGLWTTKGEQSPTYVDYSDNLFTINYPNDEINPSLNWPLVKILSPNGGEVYKAGQEIKVKWETKNVPSDFKFDVIRLRNINLRKEYNLIYNILNDGSEIVTIPSHIPDGSYTLEMKAYLNNNLVMDGSDQSFIIGSNLGALSIKVLSPNGGETFIQNADNSIAFNYKSPVNEFIQIGLVDAKATNNSNLVGNPYLLKGWISAPGGPGGVSPFTGSFNWGATEVCDLGFITCWPVSPGEYKILVQMKDEMGNLSLLPSASNWDVSNRPFKISKGNNVLPIITPNASIRVLSPNGGETFTAGQQMTVRWSSSNLDPSDYLFIALHKDGMWDDVTYFNSINDGNETFVIPLSASGKFKIRVGSSSANIGQDYSDNFFKINNNVEVYPMPIGIYEDCTAGSIYSRTTGQKCLPTQTEVNISLPSTKIIAKGTANNEVKTVQSALTKQGYPLTTDGKFGPKTEEAVKKFQISRGLTATGVIDDATMSMILVYLTN